MSVTKSFRLSHLIFPILLQQGIQFERLEFIYLVIIIANCFTGYVEEKKSVHVVLELKKIIWKYLKTYFLIDIVSILGKFNDHVENTIISVRWAIILDSTKILRTPILYKYSNNLMKVKKVGVS